MKAAFIHDHCFAVTPSGAVYTTGKLSYGAWQRYLKVFESLTVVARQRPVTEDAAVFMQRASGERVSFRFVPNVMGSIRGLRDMPAAGRALREELDRADALIARTSLLGIWAASMARRMGKPHAVEAVGDAWDAYWHYGGLAGKAYAPFAWWTMRRCLRQAPFALYVTRDYLQRRYPCPGVCVYASNVEIAAVGEDVLRRRRDRSWTIDGRGPVVGMIGSLANRNKGLDVALRAIRRLKGEGIEVTLRVLGGGKLDFWREEATRLGVEDALILDGTLPSGEPVMRWLDDLDIYIQPSFQEGLPRALIEAMSRGLPALASTCGGIPELLPAECLHRPGDDRALASQWAHMIRDADWRRACAARNFEEAREYEIERISARRDAFWSAFGEFVTSGRA